MKFDWTYEEINKLNQQPLMVLMAQAQQVHGHYHQVGEVQVCTLISIKTGGCPEDCKYCAQSSRYQTPVAAKPLMEEEEVLKEARRAIARGATRICLGAAWREVRDSKQFERVLRMVKGIADLGVEVCCTLGMLQEHQAEQLKEAGLYAYNHNLDTSENYYKTIITTRTYQDRLNTLDIVEKKGLSVCCGGIIGLGETIRDRLELILSLCTRNPHPESVPINILSRVSGTPLEKQSPVPFWETVRMIALARLTMPRAIVRLSAGRVDLSPAEQALCFLSGANSIFSGRKVLLTVPNPSPDDDDILFEALGLTKRPPYAEGKKE